MYVNTSYNMVVSLLSISLYNSVSCLNFQKCQGLTEENNIPVTSLLSVFIIILGCFIFLHTHIYVHTCAYKVSRKGVLLSSPQLVLSAYIFLQACFMHLISVKLLECNICNIAGGRNFNYMFLNESYRK